MQIHITIYFFIPVVMQIHITTNKKGDKTMITYASYFKRADKKTRKILIQNLAEEYEESDVHERRYLKKQYEQIQQILFQEGKRPM